MKSLMKDFIVAIPVDISVIVCTLCKRNNITKLTICCLVKEAPSTLER